MLINRLFAKTPSQTLKSKNLKIEIEREEERECVKFKPHLVWLQNSPRSASHPSRIHRGCLPEIDSPAINQLQTEPVGGKGLERLFECKLKQFLKNNFKPFL